MNLDNSTAGPAPIRGAVALVLQQARAQDVRPDQLSQEQLAAWATPLVRAVVGRVFPPRHMTRGDLEQEAWVGVMEAVKTFDGSKGTFRHWVARHALQRVYDAVRWTSRHSDELEAVQVEDVANVLQDLSQDPEDIVLHRKPRERVAHHVTRCISTLSPAARTLLTERLRGADAQGTPEERLAKAGLTGDIARAAQELVQLGMTAMREVVLENRFAYHRRP